MTQELFWIYGFNILVNSVLSFATVTFLVLAVMWACRVKDPRIRSLLLFIPLMKLCVDLFLYNFSNWALMQQLSPIEVEAGSRLISLSLFCPGPIAEGIPLTTNLQLFLDSGQTFTIADLLACYVPVLWMKIVVLVVVSFSIGLLSTSLFQMVVSIKKFSKIIRLSTPSPYPIHHPHLRSQIQKGKVKIVITTEVDVPCAFGIFRRSIIFPKELLHTLTQPEYEAIIAHELDHLQWQDGLVRVVANCLKNLFWWVPTRRYLSRLELTQEYACDRKITALKFSPVELASAILKAAKLAKTASERDFVPITCFVNRSTLLGRTQMLLKNPCPPKKQTFRWVQYGLTGLLMMTIIFGKFWIF